MELPEDPSLPFFAYGLFRRGQLGFLRIRDSVESIAGECTVDGTLLERDGLPMIDPTGGFPVLGDLVRFKAGHEIVAYEAIVDLEPGSQYVWGRKEVASKAGNTIANVLFGKSPGKGSVPAEYDEWQAESDPVLTTAVEVAEQMLAENAEMAGSLEPLFRLEAAYLLLWTAIERYASLRYCLGGASASKKVMRIADESAFGAALADAVQEKRTVQRADHPNSRLTLDPSRPLESLEYYYQIRSNMTHRGKAAFIDFERLRSSLEELLIIFRSVLLSAFEDAGKEHS